LFSHQIALDLHRERQRAIERQLELRRIDRSQIRRRSVRRRVGQALIQLGSAIASDGPTVVAASL
jgi:hypothetical protein